MSVYPNTAIDGTKSMPCIELAPPILDASSDHSFASYKSFNTVHERENQKPAEVRSNVKALIDKHRSFQEHSTNSKSNVDCGGQKSFGKLCEKSSEPTDDCVQMKGDTKQVEDVENVVNNHVFETCTDHRTVNNPKPQDEAEKRLVSNSENLDLKTGKPERFWQNIVFAVRVNDAYHQCLKQIADGRTFKNLEDVMVRADLALKEAGDESEQIGSELIVSSKPYLEKFGIALDGKLNENLKKTHTPSDNDRTISALRLELAENKRRAKVAENCIAQLQKEKKDLLNILTSYDSEDIHKVSLEKRLEAEQRKNNELRDLISNIFKKKMPFISPNIQ